VVICKFSLCSHLLLVQVEKLQLQAALHHASRGGSASEAKQADLEESIHTLRYLHVNTICRNFLLFDTQHGACWAGQKETLAKKNGDLETSLRKVRKLANELEGERNKLLLRYFTTQQSFDSSYCRC
jgi:hypothetical protein